MCVLLTFHSPIKKTVIMDYTLQVVRVSTVRLFRIKLNKLIPYNLFYKEQFLEFPCIFNHVLQIHSVMEFNRI